MPILLSSRNQIQLQPTNSSEYREEILFSSSDASRYGVQHGQYGVLKTTNVIPDVPGREYAVRLTIGNIGETRSNTLAVSLPFFEELQFGLGQEWELHRADRYQSIQSLTLEPSVEQEHLRDDLRRMRRDAFTGRCLLVNPGQTANDLSLRVSEQAFFNVRDVRPSLIGLREPTIFGIEERGRTEINLFVPHRKGGIDMVIVVDVSNSMDLRDYVDRKGTVGMRIQGVRQALETLLQQRLYAGSRVSRFALVGFGRTTRVIYPLDREDMIELSSGEVDNMRREVPNLTRRIGDNDRNGSDIAEAMDTAANLLYKSARDDNEKVIILLSDGASWTGQKDTGFQIEIKLGRDDPVMFADNLYDEGQIRIHTVAISDEDNVRRYEPDRYREDSIRPKGQRVWIPNPEMLGEIARRTRAKFFSSPDAEILNKLFEDLGQGAIFPIL